MTDTVSVELPANLSYSQKSGLIQCGGRYYLERGQNVPQRPGWANAGGTAAHSTTEELDRRLYETGEHIDDLPTIAEIFDSFLAAEVQKYERISKFSRVEFRASGRASKEWPNKEDRAWWTKKGPEMCMAWVRWRDNSPFTIAYVDNEVTCTGECEGGGLLPAEGGPAPCPDCGGVGTQPTTTLAIELECRPRIAETEVVAFVDRLMVQETEAGPVYMVLDLKFGARDPDSSEQLIDYRIGINDKYGIDPKWGTYWMGRKAINTPPADLHATSYAQVEYGYRKAHEQRMNNDFRYHPSNLCNGCSVNAYCPVFGGEFAGTIPQPWDLTAPPTLRPPRDRV